jgi:hypothetical protein
VSRWWRAYDHALNNRKLQQLGGDTFKGWFNLCCIASAEQAEGVLPSMDDLSFALRMNNQRVAALLTELVKAKLIDKLPDGGFKMHDWEEFQYPSDRDATGAERAKRYRDAKRNARNASQSNDRDDDRDVTRDATVTAPVTSQTSHGDRDRAETEQNRKMASSSSNRGGLIGETAYDLTDKLLKQLGKTIDDRIAYGAPAIIQGWLADGITDAAIEMGVMKLKHLVQGSDPPSSFAFFRKSVGYAQRTLNQQAIVPENIENDQGNQRGSNHRRQRPHRSAADAVLAGIEAAARDRFGGGEPDPVPAGGPVIDG